MIMDKIIAYVEKMNSPNDVTKITLQMSHDIIQWSLWWNLSSVGSLIKTLSLAMNSTTFKPIIEIHYASTHALTDCNWSTS